MRTAISIAAIAASSASGCMSPYVAGSLGPNAPRVGCLDLDLAHVDAPEAHGPALRIRFGNRCDHRAIVDLASMRVVGSDGHGGRVELTAYDPSREIRALALDAFGHGYEAIEYDAPRPLGEPWVDVEISRIARDAASDTAGDGASGTTDNTRWVRVELAGGAR